MPKTNYRGSTATRDMVAKQIAERFGPEVVQSYNPYVNCRTYKSWLEEGYQVKKGEKAIKSVTFVEVKNESGEVIKKYSKIVNLFYEKQVEQIAS